MNRTPLDAALADYFRSEMPHPWPAAPAPASPAAPAHRDPARRARYTLAASVAALAGACWLLSNGAGRPTAPGAAPAAGPDVLQNATARDPRAPDKAKVKAKADNDPMADFRPGTLPLP